MQTIPKTFIAFIITLIMAVTALAQSVPSLINYQGRLTDQTAAPLTSGSYGIQFRLWDSPAATNVTDVIWAQQQNVTVQSNGVFNVILGSSGGNPISGVTPAVTDLAIAFTASNRFLGVTVASSNGVSLPSPAEILPRQQLLSTPYAIQAGIAATAQTLVTPPIPRGVIVVWYGSVGSIPAGWALCDGGNGTPDLRNRFIVGASIDNSGSAVTTVEGSATQNGGSISHQHSGTTSALNIGRTRIDDNSGGTDYDWMDPSGHSHTFTTGPSNHLPPYYALAYIMKL